MLRPPSIQKSRNRVVSAWRGAVPTAVELAAAAVGGGSVVADMDNPRFSDKVVVKRVYQLVEALFSFRAKCPGKRVV
jgi:hypothetical protein